MRLYASFQAQPAARTRNYSKLLEHSDGEQRLKSAEAYVYRQRKLHVVFAIE